MSYNTIVSIRIHEIRCYENTNQEAENQSNHHISAAGSVAKINRLSLSHS